MNQRQKGRSGQSLVEFTMVVPLLVILLFGIIQYGFIFAAYITVRNAATVAARYAVLSNPSPSVSQIQNVAKGAVMPMLASNSVAAVNVTHGVTVGSVSGATSVQIQYNLPLIIPSVVIGNSGNTLSISATSVMQ